MSVRKTMGGRPAKDVKRNRKQKMDICIANLDQRQEAESHKI